MKAILPKIKFKNFYEKWNRKKLQSIAPLRGGYAFKSEKFQDSGIPIVRISNIKFDGTVGGEFEYYSKINPDEKFVLRGRSILLAMSGATTGKIAMLDSEEEYYQNQRVGYFQNTGAVDYDFLSSILQTKDFTNQLNSVLVAGAQPNISSKEIDSFVFYIPESLDEQSAIGSFFLVLDNLLASYKDNLVNYQSLKATMLSKMFPKAGQTVPEIRLDGFEGAWECLKIAEIFQIIDGDRGKSYPGESDFYSVGHTLFLDTGNVKKSGLDFSTTKFISEEKDKELRNGKLILGDFILTSRGTLGNVAYYNENIQKRYSSVRINSAMLILRPLLGDKISPDYILAVLRGNLISDFMKVNQVGSAQPHITKKEFSKIKVLVPSNIQEQQAIGSYFSNLDNLINTYQEKISKLETLKKKLLQDMFI